MISASIVLFNTDINYISNIKRILDGSCVQSVYWIDNSASDILKSSVADGIHIYIKNKSNTGYGAAHNIGIKRAIDSGSKYHLVLNYDVDFDPVIIKELTGYIEEHTSVGLISPKIFYPDGSIQYSCKLLPTPVDLFVRRFVPFESLKLRMAQKFELRFTKYNSIMLVPYLSGCFMLFRIDALKKTGLFDEKFFMYPEDIDLTRRVNENYDTVFYPFCSIVHHHRKESYDSHKMLFIHVWNIIKYFNKWGWLFDRKRKVINKKILKQLNYRR